MTASIQAGDSADTCSVPLEPRRTVVALCTAGPTASRHANATFSSVSGALRITSASTPGITLLAWITGERIASRMRWTLGFAAVIAVMTITGRGQSAAPWNLVEHTVG